MTRKILSRQSPKINFQNNAGWLLFAFARGFTLDAGLGGGRSLCGVEKVLRFLMRLLRKLKRFGREFHGLFGMLVTGQVIFLVVMRPRSQVSVCGEIVKFSGALVPVVAA